MFALFCVSPVINCLDFALCKSLKGEINIRVPILSFRNRELELWFTGDLLSQNSPQFTLMDARIRRYLPGEIKGPLLIREYGHWEVESVR
jgi:hypothetical protein